MSESRVRIYTEADAVRAEGNYNHLAQRCAEGRYIKIVLICGNTRRDVLLTHGQAEVLYAQLSEILKIPL